MIPAGAVKAMLYSLVSTLPYDDCHDLEFISKYIFCETLTMVTSAKTPEKDGGEKKQGLLSTIFAILLF